MFGREVHGAFEEALKTKPDRIVLTGLDEWTENGVSKGTRCQIKMVPAPLQSADKRNIKVRSCDRSSIRVCLPLLFLRIGRPAVSYLIAGECMWNLRR
eukprot:3136726-Rhodomonas_salina.2